MEGHPRGADSLTPPKQYSMSRVCINRQLPVVYWLRSAYTGKNSNRSDTRPAILFHPPAKKHPPEQINTAQSSAPIRNFKGHSDPLSKNLRVKQPKLGVMTMK